MKKPATEPAKERQVRWTSQFKTTLGESLIGGVQVYLPIRQDDIGIDHKPEERSEPGSQADDAAVLHGLLTMSKNEAPSFPEAYSDQQPFLPFGFMGGGVFGLLAMLETFCVWRFT